MAILILARHGRTSANAHGVLAGRTSGVGLDDVGHEQARAAAGRLHEVPLHSVVTSPLQRCRETARLLAPGTQAHVDRGLIECDYGTWTGQPMKKLVKEKLWSVVQTQPSAVQFPDGESMAAMSARAVAAVRQRDAQLPTDAVWLAVSHGDIVKAILADALGMHLDAFQRIVVDPASLSVIRYTEQRAFVLAMNTTSGSLKHLAPTPKKKRTTNAVPDTDATVGGGAGPNA